MSFKINITILLLYCSSQISIAQLGINVVGSWDYTVSSTDITDAGSDFTGIYPSASNQVTIDITYPSNGNVRWEVSVSKQDIDWNNSIELYARRTGSGSGQGGGNSNGFVQQGTTYQQITSMNQFFFQGRKKRNDIPIQYEIRNVSVLIPAKTYETTIIYTVTEQ
jgi:hypothetical protein